MKTNKNEIIMTVAEIIAAINNETMTAAEIRKTVTHTQMTKIEIEAEAADWWGTDWTADDIEEIDERYLKEYGILLTDEEKEDLEKALKAYEPDSNNHEDAEEKAAYEALFGGGESRKGFGIGVNYMICRIDDHRELYAEHEIQGDTDDPDWDDFEGFEELKAEIISQAAEYGITEDQINITW